MSETERAVGASFMTPHAAGLRAPALLCFRLAYESSLEELIKWHSGAHEIIAIKLSNLVR
jgi:hypothetical protein